MRQRRTDRLHQYESGTYKELQAVLAANVRRMRVERGWSQERAAHECGMSARLLQRLEAGTVNATMVSIARVCSGFEVAAAALFAIRLEEDKEAPSVTSETDGGEA